VVGLPGPIIVGRGRRRNLERYERTVGLCFALRDHAPDLIFDNEGQRSVEREIHNVYGNDEPGHF